MRLIRHYAVFIANYVVYTLAVCVAGLSLGHFISPPMLIWFEVVLIAAATGYAYQKVISKRFVLLAGFIFGLSQLAHSQGLDDLDALLTRGFIVLVILIAFMDAKTSVPAG